MVNAIGRKNRPINPFATLSIQTRSAASGVEGSAGEFVDGKLNAPAVIFHRQDAANESHPYFDGGVEFTFDEENGYSETMSIVIHGVGRRLLEAVDVRQGDVYIKLDAGYVGTDIVPEQTMFYGVVDYIYPSRNGPDVTWEIGASSKPSALYIQLATAELEETETIGSAIEKLLEASAFKLGRIDPKLFGNTITPGTGEAAFDQGVADLATLENHAFSSVIGVEVNNLLKLANEAFSTTFVASPVIGDLFTLDILDSQNPGDGGVPTVNFDLDAKNVYSVGLQYNRDEEVGSISGARAGIRQALTETVLELQQAESSNASAADIAALEDKVIEIGAMEKSVSLPGIRASILLDPRLRPPMVLKYAGTFEGSGTGVIRNVAHDLSSWTTTFSGNVIESDTFG